jgi:hypothetical protein
MKIAICLMAVATGLVGTQLAAAQAAPPAGSTGVCKDGTYTSAATKSGACRGHKGVQTWLAASSAPATAPAAKTAATAPAAAATTTPVAAPAAAATAAPVAAAKSAKSSPSAKAAAMPQAAGGGPGLVWVNTSSNVYHCYGTDYYGKTKAGSYMSEADAKAKGAHADHGKACSN